jgi:hypothetical protein
MLFSLQLLARCSTRDALQRMLLLLLLLLHMVLVGQHRQGGISHASLLVTCDSGCNR